jgi:hypothetical protein
VKATFDNVLEAALVMTQHPDAHVTLHVQRNEKAATHWHARCLSVETLAANMACGNVVKLTTTPNGRRLCQRCTKRIAP